MGRDPPPPSRHRHDRADAVAVTHARCLRFDLGSQILLDGEQEVAPVAIELEGEQVVGKQTRQQLRGPRTDAQAEKLCR